MSKQKGMWIDNDSGKQEKGANFKYMFTMIQLPVC